MTAKDNSLAMRFVLRWFVSALGIWVAASIIGGSIDYQDSLWVIIISGLVLAIVNTVLKPIIVILSLPAILFSLGLFMIVINGFMLVIVSLVYSPLNITNFWAAMLAGMIIGLVNYLVLTIMEARK